MELTEYIVEEESEVPSSKDVTGLEEGNNEFPETKATLAAGLDFKMISRQHTPLHEMEGGVNTSSLG